MPTQRRLQDLISVGPAMLRDFELVGIRRVAQLARQNPERLGSALQVTDMPAIAARENTDLHGCCSKGL